MRVIDCEQNTPEWHAARCGRLTASRIADIVRQTKSGTSAMRETYLAELVAERLRGEQEDGYCSPEMQHGKDNEDLAARVYAFENGAEVTSVGFVVHPRFDMAGCSPDRLVGGEGLLQIKCPLTKMHIATMLGKPVAPDYVKQMQWEIACTEREWCDFVSHDPRLPVDLQQHVTRFDRDDRLIATLEEAAKPFLDEVAETVERLLNLCRQEAA
ncbi:MAG: YqaJ viral recombinase family protein [Caldilineaceae bacterium]|nr:YqaJ viral recombinase family protein [Caldilineaceae bacterium]